MSKQMTPCEKLGYKVGDRFEMIVSDCGWIAGEVVKLVRDDGTVSPEFEGVTTKNRIFDDNRMCLYIEGERTCVKLIPAKLKPAKQALADAIHKNGGWRGGFYAVFGKVGGRCIFCDEKPYFSRDAKCWYVHADKVVGAFSMKSFVNWHQCVLSRDEYFTAYPEQVNVEVGNETGRKVEVEMTSESEMTIKVGDWHKNGELPPVGEVCEAYIDYPPQWVETEIVAHKDGFAIGWCKSVMKGCHGDKAHEFRPLSTERDKAIDEMVCEFIDHHGDPKGGERYLGIAAKLYDAGYRKEVK